MIFTKFIHVYKFSIRVFVLTNLRLLLNIFYLFVNIWKKNSLTMKSETLKLSSFLEDCLSLGCLKVPYAFHVYVRISIRHNMRTDKFTHDVLLMAEHV